MMTAVRLGPRIIRKPWGCRNLLPPFRALEPAAEPVGEIWFEDRRGSVPAQLLVKYLFTSATLSVQVHPDEATARKLGLPSGKDEAWLVLDAEPGARIGLGVKAPMTRDQLRCAALDRSIEQCLDWLEARAGDFIYVPAGTIHAIGPGLKLIEIQQNADVTFRLYDFGRARELHLELALQAARPEPYQAPFNPRRLEDGCEILAAGRAFVVERWRGKRSMPVRASAGAPIWLIPLAGGLKVGEEVMEPGSVWLSEHEGSVELASDGDLLLAYAGAELRHPFRHRHSRDLREG